MCGICGIVHRDNRTVDPADLVRMCEGLQHRGPDDRGVWVDGSVGLAMQRLSIIDLEGGKQPMPNETGSVQAVCNGEIYNYREVRTDLQGRHAFATESDTEVVVHAFEEYGPSFLDRLRGMFGLAVWDAERRSLTLAVDRFGIKPLYYSAGPDRLVFASELGALLRAPGLSRELDMDAIAQYFTLGYIPPPRTVFSSIRKMAPATALQFGRDSTAEPTRYWDDSAAEPHRAASTSELHDELRAALRDAVSAHLVSDVPLGAFLSGGIDSSTIVALMSELMDEPVKTFSIGFGDRDHDELHLARTVAQRFGTDHTEFMVTLDAIEVLPELVSRFGEPFADSSALPTYYVSKCAREVVKVALSGDGGDEQFVGYNTFRGLALADYAQRFPRVLRSVAAAAPERIPGISGRRGDKLSRLLKVLRDTAAPPHSSYLSKMTRAQPDDLRTALTPEFHRDVAAADPFEPFEAALAERSPEEHMLEPFLRAERDVSLAGDMLVKVDRMSMANSLEVRVPMLDHVLASFVGSIPIPDRFPRLRLKGLLKDAMSDVLPQEILRAPKHGFSVPLARWFREDLGTYARDVLLSPEARARGFLDADGMSRLIEEHKAGRRNLATLLWELLVFELWCAQTAI